MRDSFAELFRKDDGWGEGRHKHYYTVLVHVCLPVQKRGRIRFPHLVLSGLK